MALEVTNYQCPACTGPLQFVGNSGQLECEYCGNSYEVAEVEALYADKDKAAAEAKPTQTWATDTAGSQWDANEAAALRAYSCPSCGAEIICDEHTAATSCVYCGNPTIVPGQLGGALKPDYVIPFRLDKDAAMRALKAHYRRKRFLPSSFASKNTLQEIKGIYTPFWLFDADVNGTVIYDGTRKTTTTDGDYRVETTKHYQITRTGSIAYNRIPVDGSTKMPDELMDAIEPFNYKDLTPFSSAYLPGYFADKYDQDADVCAERAYDRINVSTQTAFAGTIKGFGGVSVRTTSLNMHYGDVKYALLPVWLLNTTWNGKHFQFAMNGQTGKLIGDLPVDKKSVAKWFFGVLAVLTAISTWITLWAVL